MLSECLLNSIFNTNVCSGGRLLYFVWDVGIWNFAVLRQTGWIQVQAQVSLPLWNLRWDEYFNQNSCSLLLGEQCFLSESAVRPHSILTEATEDNWGHAALRSHSKHYQFSHCPGSEIRLFLCFPVCFAQFSQSLHVLREMLLSATVWALSFSLSLSLSISHNLYVPLSSPLQAFLHRLFHSFFFGGIWKQPVNRTAVNSRHLSVRYVHLLSDMTPRPQAGLEAVVCYPEPASLT